MATAFKTRSASWSARSATNCEPKASWASWPLPGAPAATSAYPLPAGYRIEGLSVADDDVVITYAAPRLEDSTYDEVQGRLVLSLEDNGFVEVDRTEEPIAMAPPEPLAVEAGRPSTGPGSWATAGAPASSRTSLPTIGWRSA